VIMAGSLNTLMPARSKNKRQFVQKALAPPGF
jgi:hypothetical protein